MKKMMSLSLIAAAALSTSAFAASDLAGAFKEGTTSGYVRAMYINDTVKNGDGTSSLGLGGKLGYVTGSLNGFKVGATFFTTNAINQANIDKNDAYIFNEDKKGYNILGEAYVQYDIGKTTVKVGRQQLDTPLAGSDDIRLVPNMFEAYTLINTDLADTTLVVSHVTKMSGLDSLSTDKKFDSFVSMSDAAGIQGITGSKAVTVAGAIYAGLKDTSLQVWNYYGYDMVNATYADATYTPKLTSDLTLTLAAQVSKTAEMGKLKDAWVSANTSYELYGAKAAVASESTGLTGTLAYNKVTGNDKTVTLFGYWGGYPEYAIADEFWMNSLKAGNYMAKSSVMRAAVDLGLGAYGLGDRTLTVAQSKFNLNEAISGENDVTVTDFIYSCKPTKALAIRAVYETRDYKSTSDDDKRLKLSATYSF